MKSGRSSSLGTLALIATAALWGSNHVVARAAREAVPLPALAFWRWLPAAAILTVIALPVLREEWPAIRARLGGLVVGGAIGVGLFSYFLLGGAYQSLAIEVGFINATTPVWVLVFGLWMGEGRLSPGLTSGIALAFIGTLLIVSKGEPRTLTELRFGLGNLWSLLSAMTFAWFSIRVRDWSRNIAPLSLMVVTGWSGLHRRDPAGLHRLDHVGRSMDRKERCRTRLCPNCDCLYRACAHDARQSVLPVRRLYAGCGDGRRLPLSQPAVFGRLVDPVVRGAPGVVSHRWVRRDPGRADDHQHVRTSTAAFGAGLIRSRVRARKPIRHQA
jgi:hypothetical protein